MNTTETTRVSEAIENFLSDWDRQEWMQDHGVWASDEWEGERDEYNSARTEVESAISEVTTVVGAISHADSYQNDWDIEGAICETEELLKKLKVLMEIGRKLDGHVRPDESDYISEGTIDPDMVSNVSTAKLVWEGPKTQGWDCKEWYDGYRIDDALYMHWCRDAWGNRHNRDLWVLIDDEFFNNND